jgi:hypothetical protein
MLPGSRLLAVILSGAAALVAPAPARAAATVTCHCFTSRAFDAADPLAADPYILAATRSSLLSAATGVEKADLVRAVMGGTLPEDLWIAHWGARAAGATPGFLLAAHEETRSWKAPLVTARGLPPSFREALARGASSVELAAIAVDDVLVRRLGADAGAIRAVRDAGASSEEAIVAVFLAPRLRAAPAALLARVRAGRASWGALLAEAGLTAEQIEAAVRAAVR